jgi:predicted aspartyl protease
MRSRYYWVLSVLLGLVMAGQPLARGYQETQAGQTIHIQTVQTKVRFDLYRDYLIVVRGSVGPLKGLNFLLDTGAIPTVLDPRIARKLHLEERPTSIAVLGGRVQGGQAIVPSLEFGPIRKDNFYVLVEDLSFLEKALPVRIDGMIGLDVLGQSSFMIDYPSRTIHFGPPPPLSISIPLRVKEGVATVDAEINHMPVRLLVDTGASSFIIFEKRMPQPVLDMKISAVQRSTNMIGDFERNQVWLRSLRFGEAELWKQPAFVVHNSSDAGQDFDGLMSPVALGITRVAVDRERGVLAFSR